jgi:hypothetical protein
MQWAGSWLISDSPMLGSMQVAGSSFQSRSKCQRVGYIHRLPGAKLQARRENSTVLCTMHLDADASQDPSVSANCLLCRTWNPMTMSVC